MVVGPDGYEPVLEVILDTVTLTSSMNDYQLLSAESCSVCYETCERDLVLTCSLSGSEYDAFPYQVGRSKTMGLQHSSSQIGHVPHSGAYQYVHGPW
jgi:hypothetical protein